MAGSQVMESRSAAGRKHHAEIPLARISPRWLLAVLSIFARMAEVGNFENR